MDRLILAAIDVARRNQHAAVRPEHVLVAIAENEEFWRKCLPPIARHVFAHRVAGQLAEIPADGGYRGTVVTPPLLPETQALFAPSRWLRRQTSLGSLLHRFRLRTRVFEEARLDLGSVRDDLKLAVQVAAGRANVVVHIPHVVWAITDSAWFTHALRTVGGDRARVFAALADRLAAYETGRIDIMRLSDEVRAVVAICEQRPSATSDTFLGAALEEDRRLERAFEDAGVDVGRLRRLLEDGV